MKFHLVLGLFVAPLAAIVGQYSAPMGLIAWVVFLSWATFFASGGQVSGLLKTFASVLVGLGGGYLVLELAAMSASFTPILLPLAAVIFVFCLMGTCKCFFIPGAFVGCASYMGAGALPWETFISLVLGVILGFITEQFTQKLTKTPKA